MKIGNSDKKQPFMITALSQMTIITECSYLETVMKCTDIGLNAFNKFLKTVVFQWSDYCTVDGAGMQE